MTRLEKSSGFKGTVVTASKGVAPRKMVEDEKTITDPHAWQSLANGKIYVANIRDALIAADPDGKSHLRGQRAEIPRWHRRHGDHGERGDRQAAARAPQDHHHA